MKKRLVAVALACVAIAVLGVLAFTQAGASSSGEVTLTRQADGSMVLADLGATLPCWTCTRTSTVPSARTCTPRWTPRSGNSRRRARSRSSSTP
ncbi:hypothetical protein ACFQQB_14680 [Nonomuraea rubra]|uniref:hypothetical protein n=1 Tax=Nonomuraea rubra TaxID=46180 RepID=UPI0036175398